MRGRLETRAEPVLEDDAADGDAEALAELAQEDVEGDGVAAVGGRDGRLDGEVHADDQGADADAGDDVDGDPDGGRGVVVEQDEEAGAEGGEEPA